MLTKDGSPRKAGAFCKSKWAKSDPALAAACVAEAERAAAAEDDRRALKVAAATDALLTLAAPVLTAFERRKQLAGLLDYDDLITRTPACCWTRATAWVLFKLDGGLDHLLLDEVQDTAPEQWQIAGALTAEFFAGEARGAGRAHRLRRGRPQAVDLLLPGRRPGGVRPLARPDAASATAAGGVFRDTVLDVSFRSTTAVLALVDAVFADHRPPSASCRRAGPAARGAPGRAGGPGGAMAAGAAPPHEAPEPWAVAERNHGLTTAPQRLAEALAQWIAAQIGQTPLPSRGRMVEAGDILVLVRRRDDFARALVRRAEGAGVPVAGLDRL